MATKRICLGAEGMSPFFVLGEGRLMASQFYPWPRPIGYLHTPSLSASGDSRRGSRILRFGKDEDRTDKVGKVSNGESFIRRGINEANVPG